MPSETALRLPTCRQRLSSCNPSCSNRAVGTEVMAQVLAAIRCTGLEAVIVAAELALESGRRAASMC